MRVKGKINAKLVKESVDKKSRGKPWNSLYITVIILQMCKRNITAELKTRP